MADDLRLTLGEARRLAVRSQRLAGPEPAAGPDGLRQVLRGLRVLQLDPVHVVGQPPARLVEQAGRRPGP